MVRKDVAPHRSQTYGKSANPGLDRIGFALLAGFIGSRQPGQITMGGLVGGFTIGPDRQARAALRDLSPSLAGRAAIRKSATLTVPSAFRFRRAARAGMRRAAHPTDDRPRGARC